MSMSEATQALALEKEQTMTESMWKGRPLSELSKAELIEAVEQLGDMMDRQAANARRSYEVLGRQITERIETTKSKRREPSGSGGGQGEKPIPPGNWLG